MYINELLQHITRTASKHVTTLFLNGCPGSGKSYLLSRLADILAQRDFRWHVLGPYSINAINIETLTQCIGQDCSEAGFISKWPPSDSSNLEWGLKDIFQQLVVHNQEFAVLVDIGNTQGQSVPSLASFFSNIREFEGTWENNKVRAHFVIVGYWDPLQLEKHYKSVNTSFPFTAAYNYYHWSGLDKSEMTRVMEQRGFASVRQIQGNVIHELTAGHPGACRDILDLLQNTTLSVASMLNATRSAAENGKTAQTLVKFWQALPVEGKTFLTELMLKRQISARVLPELKNLLLSAGLVYEVKRGGQLFLGFRSWYVELVVRFHSITLGINDARIGKLQSSELMPEITSLNQEAYEVISDIENQVRNFVVLQLCLIQSTEQHILNIDIPRREKQGTVRQVNLYDKATDWRVRSLNQNLPVDISPLITFLSTRELADLVKVIAERINSDAWSKISQSIRQLAVVRDAVMHNQLIDLPEVDKLIELQAQVYVALNQST